MALASTLISELQRLLGAGEVLTCKEDLIPYSFDGTAALRQMPGAVVFPKTTDQVVSVLRLANQTKTPVVTRGSGTGLSGGSLPSPDCLVLCLVKMDRVLEVDRANLTLLAEAGATTQAIADAAGAAGLFYPPDPGSMKISTIGGNVAENSGGLRGLKYGVTRNYVMGLEVVLASGEVLWTGNKCVKDVAGYSMRDLFIGSEGPLGVITRVLLKLIPLPAGKEDLVAPSTEWTRRSNRLGHHCRPDYSLYARVSRTAPPYRCVEDFAHVGLPLGLRGVVADGNLTAIPPRWPRRPPAWPRSPGPTAPASCVWPGTRPRPPAWPPRGAALFSALARVSPTTIHGGCDGAGRGASWPA
jgi:glycolate oxidase